jgi:NAD(P)-dependent dehydrogenase (short-subunit alcohol dehydrogenase family)
MQEFASKVAVVTGAGSGMGRAFAERFAREGMSVVLADIQEDALERAVAELSGEGFEVIGVPTDVSKKESLEALASAAIERFGRIHIACNNAGVEGYLDGAIWEATDKDWQWTLGVNFWSVIYGTQIFVPLLLAHGEEAHLVNTCSMTSLVRAGNMYGICKQALLALSEVTYGNLRDRGAKVGVTALFPGIIATRLFQGSRNRPPELQNESPTPGAVAGIEMRERMHDRLSGGMPPSEVAEVLLQAIRDDRLYVRTDHDWDEQMQQRFDDIFAGRNPAPPA